MIALSGSRFKIGIDTGGTFTDVIAVDTKSGAFFHTKTPSTPSDPSRGLFTGLTMILAQVGLQDEQVHSVNHGTTVATNAILEENFHNLALCVTRGFRHILEIARQSVPDGYGNSYFWVKPDRIVPLERVREVTERLNHHGNVIKPLDEEDVRAFAEWVREKGIGCVGVCLLHSYVNPDHEQRVKQILEQELPDLCVSISSEVLPEYREYERAMTTLLDAQVKPHISRYVRQAEEQVRRRLPATPFRIMQSNGGLTDATEVPRRPITTILSGPAAGVLGAAYLAELAGYRNILTLDTGGTSTDVSLVENGQLSITTDAKVGRFPVKVPQVDIVTVGTGGGSIAWVGPQNSLRVGPRSAGAEPGPMCYDKGGTQPTLTDANLVLGRLSAALLNGQVPLDVELSRRGIQGIADALGMSFDACAVGIVELSNWNQANAIREVTIQRGKSPSEYALVAFGGAGPLQAGRIAELLGIRTIIVPPAPGVTSAFGLAVSEFKHDYMRTMVRREDQLDPAEAEELFLELERAAIGDMQNRGVSAGEFHLLRSLDVRYYGEGFEIRVPVERKGEEGLGEALNRFRAEHALIWAYFAAKSVPAEIVNFRVTAMVPFDRPVLPKIASGSIKPAAEAHSGTRTVYFESLRSWVETPVLTGGRLRAGNRIVGPAIVEVFDSTTVLYPDHVAEVNEYGMLIIRVPHRKEDEA